jgi:diphthamide synthase (EF-2-diphthine--ammonia ligase)
MPWLGKTLTKENFKELKKDSVNYKFHIGFEGGYADTLILDGPIFRNKLKVDSFEKVVEDKYCGHVKINKLEILDKEVNITKE